MFATNQVFRQVVLALKIGQAVCYSDRAGMKMTIKSPTWYGSVPVTGFALRTRHRWQVIGCNRATRFDDFQYLLQILGSAAKFHYRAVGIRPKFIPPVPQQWPGIRRHYRGLVRPLFDEFPAAINELV